jgi:hypothetical protein
MLEEENAVKTTNTHVIEKHPNFILYCLYAACILHPAKSMQGSLLLPSCYCCPRHYRCSADQAYRHSGSMLSRRDSALRMPRGGSAGCIGEMIVNLICREYENGSNQEGHASVCAVCPQHTGFESLPFGIHKKMYVYCDHVFNRDYRHM